MGELALLIQIGDHRRALPHPMTILPQTGVGLTVKLKAMQTTRKYIILFFICFFNLLHVYVCMSCLEDNIARAAEIHLAATKHPFFLLLHFTCLRASALKFQNVSVSLAGLLLFDSDSDSCMAVWLIVLFEIFQGHCTHNDGGLPVMLPSWQVYKKKIWHHHVSLLQFKSDR